MDLLRPTQRDLHGVVVGEFGTKYPMAQHLEVGIGQHIVYAQERQVASEGGADAETLLAEAVLLVSRQKPIDV